MNSLLFYPKTGKKVYKMGDAHISNFDVDYIFKKTKEAICEVLTIEDISPETLDFIANEIKEGLNERTVQNWIDDFVDVQKTKERLSCL